MVTEEQKKKVESVYLMDGINKSIPFNAFLMRCIRLELNHTLLSVCFGTIAIALSLGASYTLKILIDDVLIGHRPELLWRVQGIFVLLVFLGNGAKILEEHFSLLVSGRISEDMRKDMFECLLVGQLSKLEQTNGGHYSSTILYDVDAIFDFFANGIIPMFSAVVHIILSIFVMVYLSPSLTAITLIIIPVVFLVFSFLEKKVAAWNNRLINERKNLSGHLYQVLGSIIQIRATQTESLHRIGFAKKVNTHLFCYRKISLLGFIYSMATWVLIMVPYQALMYGVGGSIYFQIGTPTIGLMLTFANYTNAIIGPLQTVANYRKTKASVVKNYHSIVEILQIPKESTGGQKVVANSDTGGISVRWHNLAFRYNQSCDNQGDSVSIHYPNCSIPANKMCLIKGVSGAGKTTLLKILFALYPYNQGEVYINDIPLSDLNIADYRGHLSYVPQEPVLMDGSVRDNLKAVDITVSDAELNILLNRLNLCSGNGRLTNGLDTEVGELGHNLSVGQRQRLAIAQGILRNSRLFIFDEPSSALDTESLSELADIILELKKDATVIVSSHDALFGGFADVVVEL